MFFFSIFCVLWHTYIVDNIPALCELDDPRRWEIRKCCNCIATDWLLPPLSDSKTRWNLWPQLYCHVMWATVKANLMLAMMIKQLFAILISHLNLEGEIFFNWNMQSLLCWKGYVWVASSHMSSYDGEEQKAELCGRLSPRISFGFPSSSRILRHVHCWRLALPCVLWKIYNKS